MLLFTCLILFVNFKVNISYKYEVVVNDGIGKCGNGMPSLDTFLDMTNLEISKPEEDLLILNGNATFLIDLPPGHKLSIKTKFIKKMNGYWVPMAVTQFIPDFCAVAFDPSKSWYGATRQLKGGARKCPPSKGVS